MTLSLQGSQAQAEGGRHSAEGTAEAKAGEGAQDGWVDTGLTGSLPQGRGRRDSWRQTSQGVCVLS